MNIIEKLKEIANNIRYKILGKATQKRLENNPNDKEVLQEVNQLVNAEEDSAKQEIHKQIGPDGVAQIAINLDDTNKIAKIDGAIDEIVLEAQEEHLETFLDNVDDEIKQDIIKENPKNLSKRQRLGLTINSINSNKSTLSMANKNIDKLTDFELAGILDNLNPETDEENKKELEANKLDLVSKKTYQNMTGKYGIALHLAHLTDSLENDSKLQIPINVLRQLKDSGKENSVDTNSKLKLVFDILELTNCDEETEAIYLKKYQDEGLSEDESAKIKELMKKDRAMKLDAALLKEAEIKKAQQKRALSEYNNNSYFVK